MPRLHTIFVALGLLEALTHKLLIMHPRVSAVVPLFCINAVLVVGMKPANGEAGPSGQACSVKFKFPTKAIL